MPSTTARPRVALVGLTVALALAGCGGQGSRTPSVPPTPPTPSTSSSATAGGLPSVEDLYRQARTSALAAASGHVQGYIVRSGEKATIEIVGTLDGTNQKLTMSLGAKGTMTAISIDTVVYVKGDKAFWDAAYGAGAAEAIGEKYVKLTGSDTQDFASTTISGLLTTMFSDQSLVSLDKAGTTVTKGTVDGVGAYRLVDAVTHQGELDVTSDGKALVLRISSTGTAQGELRFSDWNRAPRLTAPPAAEVVTR